MKNLFKTFCVLFALFMFAGNAAAQINFDDPRYAVYGSDAATREKNFRNYAYFGESITAKNYKDAYERLVQLMQDAPEAHENLYIRGRIAVLHMIDNAQTPTEKNTYIDKLMELHDLRNKYYGNVASRGTKVILAAKLADLMTFRQDDTKTILATANTLIEAAGPEVSASLVTQYFNLVVARYLKDEITPDQFLAEYDLVSKAINQSNDAEKADCLKTCDALFVQSGAADCTNLERIYKPKLAENPNDVELIKKVMAYLSSGNCKSAFKTEVAEKYFAISPSATSAYILATELSEQGNNAKALKYFEEAVKLETNNVEKSKYEIRLAVTALSANEASKAAQWAKAAISSDAQNGLAYFVLAQAYGMGSTKVGCTGLQQKAIFWLIDDNLRKAKSLITDDPDMVSKIDQSIATYAPHFPTQEDIFFDSSLTEGASYTVNCGWISGVTRVRSSR